VGHRHVDNSGLECPSAAAALTIHRLTERRLITEHHLVHNRVVIGQFFQEVATEVILLHFIREFQLFENL
jgi:hypothetical protein